jgi:predicted small secreted protein
MSHSKTYWLVIGGVVIGICACVFFRLIKSTSTTKSKQQEKNNQLKTVKTPYRYENLITYTSIFQPLFIKFNLNPNDSFVFFDLIDAIIKEGKIQSARRISEALESSGDTITKAKSVISEYTNLKDKPLYLDFEPSQEDPSSQPIYKGSIESFVKEHKLEILYDNDSKEALMRLVREKFINFGKNLFLDRLEIPINSLISGLKENNIERLEFELSEIRKILEEENRFPSKELI